MCPYLIDLAPQDLPPGPLAQFQAKRANEGETWDLLVSINRALDDKGLAEEALKRTFARWWPDLDAKLKGLPQGPEQKVPPRSPDSMIAEILELVRGIRRSIPSAGSWPGFLSGTEKEPRTYLPEAFRRRFPRDVRYKIKDGPSGEHYATHLAEKMASNFQEDGSVAKPKKDRGDK